MIVCGLHKDIPFFRCEITIKCGGLSDPLERPGLAHFTEHIVAGHIKNKYGSTNRLAEELKLGITGMSATDYGFTAPYAAVKKRLHTLVSSIFQTPADTHVERERAVILREYHEGRSNRFVGRLIEQKIAGATRNTSFEKYSDTLGTTESIESISYKDILDFHKEHYVGARTILIVVGPFDKISLEHLVKSSGIETIPQGNPQCPPSVSNWTRPEDGESRGCIINAPAAHNAEPINTFGIFARIESPAGFSFTKRLNLMSIVRSAFRDKAFANIREENAWSYGIRTEGWVFSHNFHCIDFGCKTPGHVTAEDFFYVMGKTHAGAYRDRKLFEKIRAHFATGLLIEELTAKRLVSEIGFSLCYADITPDHLAEFDETLSITFDDFRQALDSIFRNRFEYQLIRK